MALRREAIDYQRDHNERSIVIAIRKAAPHDVKLTLEPKSDRDLQAILVTIRDSYCGADLIQLEENKMYDFSIDWSRSLPEEV